MDEQEKEEQKIYIGPDVGTDELVEFIKVLSGEVNHKLPSFVRNKEDELNSPQHEVES